MPEATSSFLFLVAWHLLLLVRHLPQDPESAVEGASNEKSTTAAKAAVRVTPLFARTSEMPFHTNPTVLREMWEETRGFAMVLFFLMFNLLRPGRALGLASRVG